MRADMSGRSAAEMDDSQELPVSLPTMMPTQSKGGGNVCINNCLLQFGFMMTLYVVAC